MATPTNTELKEMSEGERLIYLITVMDSNCKAVERLITTSTAQFKRNSVEHENIQSAMLLVDQELFTQIDNVNKDILTLSKEKPSNKLFYSALSLIFIVILAFSGAVYWSGKDITENTTRITNIERYVFKGIPDKDKKELNTVNNTEKRIYDLLE